MGATLSKFSSVYPDIYSSWLKNNTNIDHLVEATIKYSYEPFSNDTNKNLIDPRTYLYVIIIVFICFKFITKKMHLGKRFHQSSI